MDRAPKMVHGDINEMGDGFLEVSRASTQMRGGGVIFGLFSIGAFLFGLYFYRFLFPLEESLIIPFLFISIAIPGLAVGAIFLFKMDTAVPRDQPIRFNLKQGKVYVYEHTFSWNPFKKWPVTTKTIDWNTLGAEIHRQAGFSGKVYIQRFALWIVSYKPGTNEVVDRFELKGNWPTTEELYSAWAYCRQYMEHGTEGFPVYPPRRQEITFRRSLFEYMRFLDPTEEGREERQLMTPGDWAFNVPFIALTFWFFIPMGIGHYVAMRFAPEAKWPPAIDAESRNA